MQKRIVLDTNFIITCVRNRIDFFENLEYMGFKILIPIQVILELENISYKVETAKTALKILKQNSFEKIDLQVSYVDEGIVRFLRKNRNDALATLDKELQDRIQNPRVVIRNKKQLELIN